MNKKNKFRQIAAILSPGLGTLVEHRHQAQPSEVKMRSGIRAIALIIFLSLLAACKTEPEQPPEPVTLQLKWVHQAQFAGFYLAQERGYYADENLAVTFLEGGPGINPFDQVASGEADFGISAPDEILIKSTQEQSIMAIAVIYQRSPVVYVALQDSGIDRPVDFVGRRVAVVGPTDLEIQFRAMIENLGLDIQQIELVPHSYDLTLLYEGKVDAIGVYATGGLIRLQQAGYQANQIWPGDYGIRMYADTLITRADTVKRNPDLITRFLRASLRGWQEAIGDVDAAVAATLSYAREADPDLQAQMMTASQPLVISAEYPIGWMQADIWQDMHDILQEQGSLSETMDANQVYTQQFLETIYGSEP